MPRLADKSRDSSIVVERLEIPNTAIGRMRGLLGRDGLSSGDGMLLTDCRWVHTWFMRFPIDVVFLNATYQVVGLRANLHPWRFSPLVFAACMTLELPAGSIARLGIQQNAQLLLID